MKLVRIDIDGTFTVKEYKNKPTLKDFQDAVGGYIERVKVRYEGKDRDAFVDEEGIMKDLPINPTATEFYIGYFLSKTSTMLWATELAPLRGPMVIEVK